MIKVLSVILLLIVAGYETSQHDGRQKRLLFYDEDGNLVKTYTNPYLRDLALHADKLPLYGNFMNPFFSFIRTSQSGSLPAFAIPVSSEIIRKIEFDPLYQHKLIISPKKDPVVASNPFCEGKRAQVPSPLNCNSFLNCWDGWSFEQDCPDGLMFSGNGYCDYAENVDCNNRTPSKPVIPAMPQPSPPQPQPVQPQPQDPSSPQNKPSSPQQPPCAQILPPSQPVPPQHPISQVPIPKPQIPQQQPPQPQPSQPQPSQPQLPQLQPSAPQVTQPQPQLPQPQPPLSQSPQLQPQLPQPQPPLSQSPQPQLPQLPFLEPQPQCNQDFETFRSQYNCNVFFVCVNRQPVKFHCPADLAYSQLLGVCDYQDRVDCGKAVLIPIIPASIPIQTDVPIAVTAAPIQDSPKQEDTPVVLIENTNYNSQSWSTTNIAMSRSDAIRQVLLKSTRK